MPSRTCRRRAARSGWRCWRWCGGQDVDREVAGSARSSAARSRPGSGSRAPAAGRARPRRTSSRSGPRACRSAVSVVTTVIPVAKRPSACLSSRTSTLPSRCGRRPALTRRCRSHAVDPAVPAAADAASRRRRRRSGRGRHHPPSHDPASGLVVRRSALPATRSVWTSPAFAPSAAGPDQAKGPPGAADAPDCQSAADACQRAAARRHVKRSLRTTAAAPTALPPIRRRYSRGADQGLRGPPRCASTAGPHGPSRGPGRRHHAQFSEQTLTRCGHRAARRVRRPALQDAS